MEPALCCSPAHCPCGMTWMRKCHLDLQLLMKGTLTPQGRVLRVGHLLTMHEALSLIPEAIKFHEMMRCKKRKGGFIHLLFEKKNEKAPYFHLSKLDSQPWLQFNYCLRSEDYFLNIKYPTVTNKNYFSFNAGTLHKLLYKLTACRTPSWWFRCEPETSHLQVQVPVLHFWTVPCLFDEISLDSYLAKQNNF